MRIRLRDILFSCEDTVKGYVRIRCSHVRIRLRDILFSCEDTVKGYIVLM